MDGGLLSRYIVFIIITVASLHVRLIAQNTPDPISQEDWFRTTGPIGFGYLTNHGFGAGLGMTLGVSSENTALISASVEVFCVDVNSSDTSVYSIRNGEDIGITVLKLKRINRPTVLLYGGGPVFRLGSSSTNKLLWYEDIFSIRVMAGVDRQILEWVVVGVSVTLFVPVVVKKSINSSHWLPDGYQWRYGAGIHIAIPIW